ncbi:MAG: DUF1565 domain-containing protein [Leptolyngbya sp. SIOISBB]|nr:DUF1565 domain-containing protein [Leptolyngbya sp. SIOISBB]
MPVVCTSSLVALSGLAIVGPAIAANVANSSPTLAMGAIAQTPGESAEYTVLHVNASSGDDTAGDGSQLRPYQTMTHALNLAEANTLILLARATYSTESGETFPLRLQPGVTIQGMAGPNAADIVIQGSGNYYSNTAGMQQVALLGADNAGLANVTVSNPHPEGIGLWIESGSPIVLDSAFFQNGATGVYIAGPGTPVIRGNYFSSNGRAGLVIAGPSTAKVEANVFENTGVGITVAPESAPEILNNRISGNLDGLIVHAEARPRLQGNQIAHNRRNSIVDYAAWATVPNVGRPGATQPPPPNVTPANVTPTALPVAPVTPVAAPESTGLLTAPPTESPVVSELATTIPAVSVMPPTTSTVLDTQAVEDALPGDSLNEGTETASPTEATEIATEPISADNFATLSEATLGDLSPREIDAAVTALNDVDISFLPSIAAVAALTSVDLVPVMEVTQSLSDTFSDSDPAGNVDTSESLDTSLFGPLPSPGAAEPTIPLDIDTPVSPAASEVIELPVIPPPIETPTKPSELQQSREVFTQNVAAALVTGEHLPELPAAATAAPTIPSSDHLAVPNREIPVGSGGSLPEAFTAGAAANLPSDGPPPPPSLTNSLGLNYKVLVVAPDETTQAAVRSQVPDAFRTRVNGQLFMQAGAYPTMTEAQARRDQLQQAGLSAQIQEMP